MSAADAMLSIRLAPALLLLASVAVIATALLSQYVGGLQPCELCLLERWPYYIAIAATLLAIWNGHLRAVRAVLALSGLIFVASGALAAYHVGVEQHWIQGPTACTGGLAQASSPEALLRALQERQPVQCDVVQWSFMGLSLAGLNLIVSLALMGFSFWALKRSMESAPR